MTVAWDGVQKSFVMLNKCAGKSPSINFFYIPKINNFKVA